MPGLFLMAPYAALTRGLAQVLASPVSLPADAWICVGMGVAAAFGAMCLWFGIIALRAARRESRRIGIQPR